MALRGYQESLRDEALHPAANAIVALPTGSGKTRVAFAVAEAALERYRDRSVVFLTPTVVLAGQQRDGSELVEFHYISRSREPIS